MFIALEGGIREYHVMAWREAIKGSLLWRFEYWHFRVGLWGMCGPCFWYSNVLQLIGELRGWGGLGRGGRWILYCLSQFTLQLECNKHSTPGCPPARDQYKAPSCSDTERLTIIGSTAMRAAYSQTHWTCAFKLPSFSLCMGEDGWRVVCGDVRVRSNSIAWCNRTM